MKYLQAILFFYCYYCFTQAAQPYFPPQIVFTTLDGKYLYAIDQVNQRAAMTYPASQGFVYKHMPYAKPDSPQDKYYVQLVTNRLYSDCFYETYWEQGFIPYNLFPTHWQNGQSFEIQNYLKFDNEMIHSTNSSDAEDYWYSNKTCQIFTGAKYPCEEVFFKKNTNIPLRSTQVRVVGYVFQQVKNEYNVLSVGEPDQKYFDDLPKNWTSACRNLGL